MGDEEGEKVGEQVQDNDGEKAGKEMTGIP